MFTPDDLVFSYTRADAIRDDVTEPVYQTATPVDVLGDSVFDGGF